MTTAIQFLRSNVPGLRPNPLTLSDGMPMINFNPQDPGLFFKANDNTLIKIGPTFVGAVSPNAVPSGFNGFGIGEMWLDTDTSLGVAKPRPILKVWDGAAWSAAGGDILKEEVPQAARTFLAGPVSGSDDIPTFRTFENNDLPDDLDYHKLQGGDLEGGLLIGGGTPGWEVANLTMGSGMTQTVGPNMITLEVSAGDIAADGQPGVNFDQGDGHVQLNYDGKFTGDARLKLINKYDGAQEDKLIAHVSTELGQDPLTHTHIIKGDTTLSGSLTITDVHNISAGGDLTIGHSATFGASPADLFQVYCTSTFYENVTVDGLNDLAVGGDIVGTNNLTAGTGDTNTHTLTGEVFLSGSTTIGRSCSDNISVLGTTVFDCPSTFNGDVDVDGTVTAEYFVGDGSQLTNLSVPSSIQFLGDIDATVGPVPTSSKSGDFYLHIGPSTTVLASWPDIGGSAIQQDQFIYFYDDGLSGKWALGSVQNQQGFVTINTDQDINGKKTFTDDLILESTLTITGDVLPEVDGIPSIGSPTKRFANVYTQDMHFSNEGTDGNDVDGTTGNWTLQEGHDHLYFINNKTGVKFRVVMEPVSG